MADDPVFGPELVAPAATEFSDINCTDCGDADWDKYPNTGHVCDRDKCTAEAVVAVIRVPKVWMACEVHKWEF